MLESWCGRRSWVGAAVGRYVDSGRGVIERDRRRDRLGRGVIDSGPRDRFLRYSGVSNKSGGLSALNPLAAAALSQSGGLSALDALAAQRANGAEQRARQPERRGSAGPLRGGAGPARVGGRWVRRRRYVGPRRRGRGPRRGHRGTDPRVDILATASMLLAADATDAASPHHRDANPLWPCGRSTWQPRTLHVAAAPRATRSQQVRTPLDEFEARPRDELRCVVLLRMNTLAHSKWPLGASGPPSCS